MLSLSADLNQNRLWAGQMSEIGDFTSTIGIVERSPE
jgi:hypothetical protein